MSLAEKPQMPKPTVFCTDWLFLARSYCLRVSRNSWRADPSSSPRSKQRPALDERGLDVPLIGDHLRTWQRL